MRDLFHSKKYDLNKIKIITALIYLNMSPLHTYPFGKLCFSLGKLLLFRELSKNEKSI